MTERKQKKGNNRKKRNRWNNYLLLWGAIASILIASTSTYAWYSIRKREADSKYADVMKPYYLTLLNPSEKDLLQLAVGNLFPGEVKQVVFCVSNKDNESNSAMNMGVSDFDYSIEMIYTENLALTYKIYKLEEATDVTEGNVPDGVIAALDTVVSSEGTGQEITYWRKVVDEGASLPAALKGTDVSTRRHAQVGVTGSEINVGRYISYAKTEEGGENGTDVIDNGLHLTAKEDGYDAQHFVLEIEWQSDAAANFDKYEKETDMIYLLVEAIQPKPEKHENAVDSE